MPFGAAGTRSDAAGGEHRDLATGSAAVAVGGRSASGRNLFLVPWRGRALFGTWESATVCAPETRRRA